MHVTQWSNKTHRQQNTNNKLFSVEYKVIKACTNLNQKRCNSCLTIDDEKKTREKNVVHHDDAVFFFKEK